jgi:hypothetical protein
MSTKITPTTIHSSLTETGNNLGATISYPQDGYPAVVIAASKSGRVITVENLRTVDTTTGHSPDHLEGGFPVWTHIYTDEERRTFREGTTFKAHWSEKWQAYYRGGSTRVSVGNAVFHRNYSF